MYIIIYNKNKIKLYIYTRPWALYLRKVEESAKGDFFVLCEYYLCLPPASDTLEGVAQAWRPHLSGVEYSFPAPTAFLSLPQAAGETKLHLYPSDICVLPGALKIQLSDWEG